MKSEKLLFPRSTEWQTARLIQRDNKYVVQSKYDEMTKTFEQETEISIYEPCAELVALNIWTETLNNAISKVLRKRANYKDYIAKHKIEITEDIFDGILDV